MPRLPLRLSPLAAIVLLATGCAVAPPPAPDEIRQQAMGDVDVSRAWQAAATDAAQVQDNWLASFADPQLDALVQEALAHNPDLRIAAARVEQAAQHLVVAQSGLKPSVGIAGTGGMKGGGGGDTSSALQGIVAAATWELDLWGRVRYARNAARESHASTQADFEFARQSLAAATAKAWFSAIRMTRRAAIAREMAASAQRLESLAEDRERVGVGTETETAQARASARDLEDTLQQLELARGQALRALEVLIGRYPAADVATRADLVPLPGPMPAGLPLQMLERRPDVIAAERRVAAAFNRIGEAKAARLPQLSLNLNFGAWDSEILQLKEDFENPAGGLGARLLAPLYQGGALNARVEIRTLEQKEALAAYAGVALRALNEVEDALAAGATLAKRVSLLTQSLDEQTTTLNRVQERFDVGRIDRRTVEQQRISVENARIALLDVRTEALTQRVNLHLALGGSFDVPQRQADARP
ncbi:MAG TPA: TolC family protein [Povalibacter sp.]|uniref:TolC family protein n=1 Tax=Povalibacter sp. TaxID=1962978 RepID=UPI002C14D412|nr:TolC family protein [Povalibacter sp.]HMN45505.1 TolC family protein [Povalibacter sp.]